MGKVHITKRFKRIRVKSPKKFDPKSFRVKDIGRPGFTKLIVGCKKGQWDSKKKRCKIGVQTQSVLLNRKDFGI